MRVSTAAWQWWIGWVRRIRWVRALERGEWIRSGSGDGRHDILGWPYSFFGRFGQSFFMCPFCLQRKHLPSERSFSMSSCFKPGTK